MLTPVLEVYNEKHNNKISDFLIRERKTWSYFNHFYITWRKRQIATVTFELNGTLARVVALTFHGQKFKEVYTTEYMSFWVLLLSQFVEHMQTEHNHRITDIRTVTVCKNIVRLEKTYKGFDKVDKLLETADNILPVHLAVLEGLKYSKTETSGIKGYILEVDGVQYQYISNFSTVHVINLVYRNDFKVSKDILLEQGFRKTLALLQNVETY